MPMSEAAKAAASSRMKARHAAAAEAKAAGGVAVAEPDEDFEAEPELLRADDGASYVSQSERFASKMRAMGKVTTNDDLAVIAGSDADILETGGGSNVERTGPGLVWMFKHEAWGWRKLKVSQNDIAMLLNSGFLDRCGDCGKTSCPGSYNGCPKGTMRMYRDCPVAGCNDGRGKRFYDNETGAEIKPVSDDPFAIQDAAYIPSTPESRTKAMLDEHIRYYHTVEAAARGLVYVNQR